MILTSDFLHKHLKDQAKEWHLTLTDEGYWKAHHLPTNVWVELIQASITTEPDIPPIYTFRRHYARMVHSEALKHRMLPVSSESSRARPVISVLKNILRYPAKFGRLGKKKKGMQDAGDVSFIQRVLFHVIDKPAMFHMLFVAWLLDKAGFHKQVANRYVERWMMINDVTTGTDFDHFFNLRIHSAVDPSMELVARGMWLLREWALELKIPLIIRPGEWHVPFVDRFFEGDNLIYRDKAGNILTERQAKEVSAVNCAQTSYRRNSATLANYKRIWDDLIMSRPPHATPVEHPATPMNRKELLNRQMAFNLLFKPDKNNYSEADIVYYSGTFRKWHQFRKEIEAEKFYGKFEIATRQ